MRRRSNSEFGMFDDDDDNDDYDERRKKEEKPFDPSNREERRDFDNPSDSIMSRRQGRATRLGGIGALGGLSIWTDAMDLDDDDDDDDNLGRLLHARGSPPRSAGANATLEELEEARGKDGDARGARPRGKQREGTGKGKESWGKGWAQTVSGTTADLRNGGSLPEGLEVVGGDPTFEEQEDGAQALIMCEGSYMKVTLPNVTPWSLEDDGRLHRFSMMIAMRCAARRARSHELLPPHPQRTSGQVTVRARGQRAPARVAHVFLTFSHARRNPFSPLLLPSLLCALANRASQD